MVPCLSINIPATEILFCLWCLVFLYSYQQSSVTLFYLSMVPCISTIISATVTLCYLSMVPCISTIIPAAVTLCYLSMVPCLCTIVPATVTLFYLSIVPCLSIIIPATEIRCYLSMVPCLRTIVPATGDYKYTITMLIVTQSTTEMLKMLLVLYSTLCNNVHIVINTENTTDYTQ